MTSDPIRIVEPESSQFQFQNFQSRSRLDARLWLRCRLALVESLLLEIKGMGNVKGTNFNPQKCFISFNRFINYSNSQ